MNRIMSECTAKLCALPAILAAFTTGASQEWNFNWEQGRSCPPPAYWTDPASWVENSLCPTGFAAIAKFSAPAKSVISHLRIPDGGVTVGGVNCVGAFADENTRFLALTGGPLILRARKDDASVAQAQIKNESTCRYVRYFCDVIAPDRVAGDKMEGGTDHTDSLTISGASSYGDRQVFGRISCAGNFYIGSSYVDQRFDRANTQGERIVDPCPTNTVWLNSDNGCCWRIYAPYGSDETKEFQGCTITGGSVFLKASAAKTFLNGSKPKVAADALVTGPGIPAGTRIRSIISDTMIELDHEATESSDGATLAVQPYRAYVCHTLQRFGQRSGGGGLRLNKWREEDVLRFSIADLLVGQAYTGEGIPLGRDTDYAGTLVLQGPVARHRTLATYLVFAKSNMHLEFATNKLGVAGLRPTGVEPAGLKFADATCSATLTVPDAGVKTLPVPITGWTGSFTKDGAGELTGLVAAPSETAVLKVKEGCFGLELEPGMVESGQEFRFGELSVASSAGFAVDTTNAMAAAESGTVEECSLRLAAGSVLTLGEGCGPVSPTNIVLEVGADGQLPTISAASADLSRGGVVSLRGNVSALTAGDHVLMTGVTEGAGDWRCETGDGRVACKVRVANGCLLLRRTSAGFMLLLY